ncbi:unnamed protein product, partial [Polarella glacialis]
AERKALQKERVELQALMKAKTTIDGFRELMEEKGVGRFDSYETWCPRMLGDARFKAVPLADRKKLFLQEAKKQGSGQQRADAVKKRQGFERFSELVSTAQMNGIFDEIQSSEEAFAKLEASEHSKDERWRALMPSDRKRLVVAVFLDEMRKRISEAEQASRDFRALLL